VQQATTMLIASIATLIARRATRRNTIADVLARTERARRLRSVLTGGPRRADGHADRRAAAATVARCAALHYPDLAHCSNENLFAPFRHTGCPNPARLLVGRRAKRLLPARAERPARQSAVSVALQLAARSACSACSA
jgi:hypothetical protein